jgi:hypothetical protein
MMTRTFHLPPMERTWEGLTVSIWSNYPGCAVITLLTREWDAAIFLLWWQGEQTKLLSNLSKGNSRNRPKPLSRHNKSKLRWPNLLCQFQSSDEDWEIKHFTEGWANEKSAWKTFLMREIPQTSLPEESRTCELDLWKRASKSTSTSWEIESRLYTGDSIQGEVVIYLDDAGTEHLTLLVIPKSHIFLVWQGSEAGEPFLVSGHVS